MATWLSAYRGILPDERLDALTVDDQWELWNSTLFRRPSRTNLVLEDEGLVRGWCAVGPARDDDEDPRHTGEVYGLYVHPEAQHQGCGTALLAHAHNLFRERGCRETVLWVLDRNTRARGFYEHCRYDLDPTARRVSDWLGVPEVRYRRPL